MNKSLLQILSEDIVENFSDFDYDFDKLVETLETEKSGIIKIYNIIQDREAELEKQVKNYRNLINEIDKKILTIHQIDTLIKKDREAEIQIETSLSNKVETFKTEVCSICKENWP